MFNYIVFGAGRAGSELITKLQNDIQILFVVDNAKDKWGESLLGYPICSPDEVGTVHSQTKVLIASVYQNEIKEQLREMGLREYIDFWVPDVEVAVW